MGRHGKNDQKHREVTDNDICSSYTHATSLICGQNLLLVETIQQISRQRTRKSPRLGQREVRMEQGSREMNSLQRGFESLFHSFKHVQMYALVSQFKTQTYADRNASLKKTVEGSFQVECGCVDKSLDFTAYQNGGDNECPVGQRISDVVGPVFVAIRHVQPTVGVPNSNLHRTQGIRGCHLPIIALMLKQRAHYTRNGNPGLYPGAPGHYSGGCFIQESNIIEK